MSRQRTLPLHSEQLRAIAATQPTPFYLYDEQGIRAAAGALQRAFAWAPGFRNFFALKATPNPHILTLLAEEGAGADCSSLPELLLAARVGLRGEQIMFTSNNTPATEFAAARELEALINLDDLGHLDYLARHVGLPEFLSFRYNPGPLRTGNAIIGHPEEAKFGLTREQLFTAYAAAQRAGVQRFGLHTMVVSNELDCAALVATATLLFTLARELQAQLGITIELINLGGGIGIPYRPAESPLDLVAFGAGVQAAYMTLFQGLESRPPTLAMECGRLITGPHGYLLTRVRHIKRTYRHYAGLDATMADLMRPGMYGAYHQISVLGKEHLVPRERYDLVGSLCENNDKFAIDRELPPLEPGDLLVIHDVGAHGRAMGFNYNGKLRPAELLLAQDGKTRLIRRAETIDDYFATIIW